MANGKKVRAGWLAALWALITLCRAVPVFCGEHDGQRRRAEDPARAKRLALSARIAEARRQREAQAYYKSLSRQEKTRRTRPFAGRN